MPADEMWKRIGDFTTVNTWLPGIESIELLDDGKKRKLTMPGGVAFVEALLEEGDQTHTYTIVEGPMPFTNYRSTLSVKATDDKSCVVDWHATFDPVEGTPEENATAIVEMIYDAGLDGISKTA
jgi:carbon monoxide dehydrogenase subunit G